MLSPLSPMFPFHLRSLSNGKGLQLHIKCLTHNGFHGYPRQHFNNHSLLPKCIISLYLFLFILLLPLQSLNLLFYVIWWSQHPQHQETIKIQVLLPSVFKTYRNHLSCRLINCFFLFFFFFNSLSVLSTQLFDTKLISVYKLGLCIIWAFAQSLQKHFSVSIVITFPIFSAYLFSTENFTWTCELRLHNVSFNCLKSYNNTTFCTLALDQKAYKKTRNKAAKSSQHCRHTKLSRRLLQTSLPLCSKL